MSHHPSAPRPRLQDLERRQEQQRKIQAEIKRINDENRRCKEEQLRQERMADEKILEYQRQKMVVGRSAAARARARQGHRRSCPLLVSHVGAGGRV